MLTFFAETQHIKIWIGETITITNMADKKHGIKVQIL